MKAQNAIRKRYQTDMTDWEMKIVAMALWTTFVFGVIVGRLWGGLL